MSDPTFFFFNFMAGLIGYALFRYGRRQSRMPHLIGAVALMGIPWLMPTTLWVLLVCTLIGALVYLLIWIGM